MEPTWGPSGADRTQVGPMLAPWTLLSGMFFTYLRQVTTQLAILVPDVAQHLYNMTWEAKLPRLQSETIYRGCTMLAIPSTKALKLYRQSLCKFSDLARFVIQPRSQTGTKLQTKLKNWDGITKTGRITNLHVTLYRFIDHLCGETTITALRTEVINQNSR